MLSISSNNIKNKTNYCGTSKTQNVSFFSAKIKSLNEDVISFKATSESQQRYINKDDIPTLIEIFTGKILQLLQNTRLDSQNVELLINKICNNEVKVKVIHKDLSLIDRGLAAMCAPIYNTDGDQEEVNLFINFNKFQNAIPSDLIHELTHILQNFTRESTNMMHQIAQSKTDIENYFDAYLEFELNILNTSFVHRKKEYDALIERVFSQYKITDKKLSLEYFKFRADKECQAYKEESNFAKEHTNRQETAVFYSLRSKLFEDLSIYLGELIKQEEAKGDA